MRGHLSGSTSSATRAALERHGCVRRSGDCEFGVNEKNCIVDFETVNIVVEPTFSQHRAPPQAHSRNFSETTLLGTPVLSCKVFVLLNINGFHLALHLFGE